MVAVAASGTLSSSSVLLVAETVRVGLMLMLMMILRRRTKMWTRKRETKMGKQRIQYVIRLRFFSVSSSSYLSFVSRKAAVTKTLVFPVVAFVSYRSSLSSGDDGYGVPVRAAVALRWYRTHFHPHRCPRP